jgi:hypothetical protein
MFGAPPPGEKGPGALRHLHHPRDLDGRPHRAGAHRRQGALRGRARQVRGARQGTDAGRRGRPAQGALLSRRRSRSTASTPSAKARPRSSTSARR